MYQIKCNAPGSCHRQYHFSRSYKSCVSVSLRMLVVHDTRSHTLVTHLSSRMDQREVSLGTRSIAPTKYSHSNGRIWQCLCFLALLFIVADCFLSSSQPLVETKWGKIHGKWTKSRGVNSNRLIANFLGIPYALPPVGDLRFKVRFYPHDL